MESYSSLRQASADGPRTLVSDGARLSERLREVCIRVSKIADTLHGPSPKPVDNGKAGAPAANSLRRNLDVAYTTMDEIENELSRIEGQL